MKWTLGPRVREIAFSASCVRRALLKAISGSNLNLKVTNPVTLGIVTQPSDQCVLVLSGFNPGNCRGVDVSIFIGKVAYIPSSKFELA